MATTTSSTPSAPRTNACDPNRPTTRRTGRFPASDRAPSRSSGSTPIALRRGLHDAVGRTPAMATNAGTRSTGTRRTPRRAPRPRAGARRARARAARRPTRTLARRRSRRRAPAGFARAAAPAPGGSAGVRRAARLRARRGRRRRDVGVDRECDSGPQARQAPARDGRRPGSAPGGSGRRRRRRTAPRARSVPCARTGRAPRRRDRSPRRRRRSARRARPIRRRGPPHASSARRSAGFCQSSRTATSLAPTPPARMRASIARSTGDVQGYPRRDLGGDRARSCTQHPLGDDPMNDTGSRKAACPVFAASWRPAKLCA